MARQIAAIAEIMRWIEEYEDAAPDKERDLYFKIVDAIRALRG